MVWIAWRESNSSFSSSLLWDEVMDRKSGRDLQISFTYKFLELWVVERECRTSRTCIRREIMDTLNSSLSFFSSSLSLPTADFFALLPEVDKDAGDKMHTMKLIMEERGMSERDDVAGENIISSNVGTILLQSKIFDYKRLVQERIKIRGLELTHEPDVPRTCSEFVANAGKKSDRNCFSFSDSSPSSTEGENRRRSMRERTQSLDTFEAIMSLLKPFRATSRAPSLTFSHSMSSPSRFKRYPKSNSSVPSMFLMVKSRDGRRSKSKIHFLATLMHSSSTSLLAASRINKYKEFNRSLLPSFVAIQYNPRHVKALARMKGFSQAHDGRTYRSRILSTRV
jgi:hypothetical protein